MATLRKRRNKYVSYIRKWNGIKQVGVSIPLGDDKTTAIARHKKVEKDEPLIKEGIIQKHQFKAYFKWLNDEGTSTLKQLTTAEAINQFLDVYKVDVALSSYKRMKVSVNAFFKAVDQNIPIKKMNTDCIEDFKKHYKKSRAAAGINLDLRNIKTFLRWCVEKELLSPMPKIKMLREPKKLFKYIKEETMEKIFSLESLSPFMKRAFYVYLTTGCRRSEIIEGKLDGSILVVPAQISKSRIEKEISLSEVQIQIVKDIHAARDTHLLRGSCLLTFKDKFTKAFKNVCDELHLKDLSFHSLRHTFAVTQWIITNDIYEVKTLLGHTSVKTTEKYAQFNKNRLANDFKKAYRVRLEIQKVRENAISDTIISDTFLQTTESSSERTSAA